MKKIYFAHSMRDYNTEKEAFALNFLRERYPSMQIVCPNNDLSLGDQMYKYIQYVKKECDGIIIMEHMSHIGAGVYRELVAALESNKMISVLRIYEKGGNFYLAEIPLIPLKRPVNIDLLCHDWKVYYAKINTPL